MVTKDQVLALLGSTLGTYYSGEEIAQTLSVSRAAIWKAVRSLREEGYPIDAVNNKGYCLSSASDVLSVQGVEVLLTSDCSKLQLHAVSSVPSTNTLMREKANGGAPEGSVILANEQTAGRGRAGRSFYSPENSGVYLSLLLRPSAAQPLQAIRMTTMAAVAMCEAIEAVSGKHPGIKWVNDIYLDGKKVCGILTEGAFSMESGQLEYAILGVGVNVSQPKEGFPEDLSLIAGTVFETAGENRKNRLTAEFLNRFMAYYAASDPSDYTEKYRAHSIVIGRRITVLSPTGDREATAIGIDDQCHLLVQYDDGKTDCLSYGEIRIKL